MSKSSIIFSAIKKATDIKFSNVKKNVISDDSKLVPIHIAYTGNFAGYSGGEFELTKDIFDNVIENFNNEGTPIPLFKGHSDVIASMTNQTNEPECYGWILGLETDGKNLYALCELTDEMKDLIQKGQFKYSSIYMTGGNVNRESGDDIGYRLNSLAITNMPFLDNLQPIVLSNNNLINIYSGKDISKMKNKKVILANEAQDAAKKEDVLDGMQIGRTTEQDGTPTTNDPMELLQKALEEINPDMDMVDFVRELIKTYEGEMAEQAAQEEGATPEEAEQAEEEVKASDAPKKEEDSKDEEKTESPEEAKKEETEGEEPGEDDKKKKEVAMSAALSSVKSLQIALTSAQKEIDKLKKENDEHKQIMLSSIVSDAVSKGKLLPSEKDAYIKLGMKDRAMFDEMLKLRGANPTVIMSRLVPLSEKQDLERTSTKAKSPIELAFEQQISKNNFKK